MPAAGPARDTAARFADYAALVARALGDRVKHWVVLNEPKTFSSVGYWYGVHAPGRKDPLAFVRATHVINLAQGEAVRAIKAVDGAAQVGSAFDVAPMYPATPSPEDAAAAERWHRFQNLWFLYPALHGRYPEGALQADRQAELLGFRDGDERIVRADFDFVGLNYYTPILVKAAPEGNGIPGLDTESFWATMHGEHPKTDIGWTVYPQGFYDILTRMAKETGSLPIEITENGASYNTAPDGEGRIRDAARIDYLRGHLADDGARDRRRRADSRVSLLEPARQLRVGVRLLAALRHRARGLCRRAAPHGQGLGPLVRGRCRGQSRQIERNEGDAPLHVAGARPLKGARPLHSQRSVMEISRVARGSSVHRPLSAASGRFMAFTACVTGSTQK